MRHVIVLLALLLLPAAAAADVVIGLDISGNDALYSGVPGDAPTPGSIDGRLGARLAYDGYSVEPELVLGWAALSPRDLAGGIKQTNGVYRGLVGGRLGIGELLRPSVFAHVGAAYYDPSYLVPQGSIDSGEGPRRPEAGMVAAMDVGAALDLAALPMFEIGLHATYNRLLLVDPLDWLGFGAHVALVLP